MIYQLVFKHEPAKLVSFLHYWWNNLSSYITFGWCLNPVFHLAWGGWVYGVHTGGERNFKVYLNTLSFTITIVWLFPTTLRIFVSKWLQVCEVCMQLITVQCWECSISMLRSTHPQVQYTEIKKSNCNELFCYAFFQGKTSDIHI